MAELSPIPLFRATSVEAGLDLGAAVQRVLDRHWYVMGAELQAFDHLALAAEP